LAFCSGLEQKMARPQLGTIAIAVCLLAMPAAAAEVTRTPQANGPDVITIRGEIEPDDHKKFIEIVSDIMKANVILNSKGGHIGTAIIIGRFIRLRNYETRVHNGAVCDSACTLIWLAGSFRHLDRWARLGFHSARTQRTPPYERSERGNAIMAAYMAGIGVPQQVIELQPKADPCCLNYIDYAQAKAWGLLSDRPAKQQALPTPETQHSAATVPASSKPAQTPRPDMPEWVLPKPPQAKPEVGRAGPAAGQFSCPYPGPGNITSCNKYVPAKPDGTAIPPVPQPEDHRCRGIICNWPNAPEAKPGAPTKSASTSTVHSTSMSLGKARMLRRGR
jgi:hypothetical protein